MKKLLSALTVFLLLSGCEQDTTQDLKKGFVQLSISSGELGRRMDAPEPAFVLLSIEDGSGSMIEMDKKLPLYNFGNGFVSESLQLVTGDYKLTKFMVLDATNKVIYATPLEGSELAGFVKDPLPINFTITEDGNTLVTPEVLEVTEENTPETFGYVNFGFEIVKVKRVKTVEHRNSLGKIMTYTEYSYNNENQLKQMVHYSLNENTNSYYIYQIWDYAYLNGRIKSMTLTQGGISYREYKYYYDNGKVSKVEMIDIGNILRAHNDFVYGDNSITIFKYTHVDTTIHLSTKHEFIFEKMNYVSYKEIRGGIVERQSEMQFDEKRNPVYFGQDFLNGFNVYISELSSYSINNIVKQTIYNSSLATNYDVNYEIEYNAEGYPVKIKSDFYKKSGDTQWISYGYYTFQYY